MKILVVEDDVHAANRIKNILNEIMSDTSILVAATGSVAQEYLANSIVDTVFIDKCLPDIDGFELALKIRSDEKYYALPIVFVTGEDSNSIEAHAKYNHFAYITKPYSKREFIDTVEKLLLGLKNEKEFTIREHEEKQRVVVLNTKDSIEIIRISDILFAETEHHAISIYTNNNCYQGIQMNIDELVDYVNIKSFVRCHRSFAVNINNIKSVKKVSKKTWLILFQENCKKECLLSFGYYRTVKKLLFS